MKSRGQGKGKKCKCRTGKTQTRGEIKTEIQCRDTQGGAWKCAVLSRAEKQKNWAKDRTWWRQSTYYSGKLCRWLRKAREENKNEIYFQRFINEWWQHYLKSTEQFCFVKHGTKNFFYSVVVVFLYSKHMRRIRLLESL